MKGYYGKEQTLARGKTVSMGIDVHAESWHVTARVAGEEVFHGRIPGEYAASWTISFAQTTPLLSMNGRQSVTSIEANT